MNKNLSTKNSQKESRILSKSIGRRGISDEEIDQLALATFRDLQLLLSIDPNTLDLTEDAIKKLKKLRSSWSV